MDDPSFYGFPCYGEPTVKAAQDCGGPTVDPDDRTSETDPGMQRLLVEHMARMLPASGRPVRSLRCQYTLTPDRDLVLSPVPGHERVVVGLGAAHGFKFAPTIGRLLADLAVDGDHGDRPHAVPARPAGAHRPRLRAALAGVRWPQTSVATSTPELGGDLLRHPRAQLRRG